MLGMGVCGSRPRNGETKWNQVVYQCCSRLVRILCCWTGVGLVHLSKRVIEMEWEQDETWDEGGSSDTCKARKDSNTRTKLYLVLGGNSP